MQQDVEREGESDDEEGIPGQEGDEGLVRRADDSEYEEVGRPPKESCEEKLEKKSHPDFLEVERDCKNEKGGVISDIVSDFKDFSSLKRTKSKGKENKDVTTPVSS